MGGAKQMLAANTNVDNLIINVFSFRFILYVNFFNGAKLRIKNEKTTIIKEKISICSRINKKSKRIDRIFLINLLLLSYLRKLIIYNKV